MLNPERNATGSDKIERYGWKMLDKPGRFLMIKKELLEIDPTYQRDQNAAKRLAIAAQWSWIGCCCLSVAKRGSRFFLMDGGHRHAGAMSRSDISALPCMVYEMDSVKDEATFFLILNLLRKAMTSVERFNAQTTSGDENAIFVRDLLAQCGRDTKGDGNSARCLAALMKMAESNREQLIRVWPLFDELCRGRPVHSHLLRGLIYVELRMPEGETLTARKWRDRLLATGADGLIDAMNKAAGFRGKSGEKVWGEGIVQRLNYGLQNKLVLKA